MELLRNRNTKDSEPLFNSVNLLDAKSDEYGDRIILKVLFKLSWNKRRCLKTNSRKFYHLYELVKYFFEIFNIIEVL